VHLEDERLGMPGSEDEIPVDVDGERPVGREPDLPSAEERREREATCVPSSAFGRCRSASPRVRLPSRQMSKGRRREPRPGQDEAAAACAPVRHSREERESVHRPSVDFEGQREVLPGRKHPENRHEIRGKSLRYRTFAAASATAPSNPRPSPFAK